MTFLNCTAAPCPLHRPILMSLLALSALIVLSFAGFKTKCLHLNLWILAPEIYVSAPQKMGRTVSPSCPAVHTLLR